MVACRQAEFSCDFVQKRDRENHWTISIFKKREYIKLQEKIKDK